MDEALSWLRGDLTLLEGVWSHILSLPTAQVNYTACTTQNRVILGQGWTGEHRSEFEEEMVFLWMDKCYFLLPYLLLKRLNYFFFPWGHDLRIVNLDIPSFICSLLFKTTVPVSAPPYIWITWLGKMARMRRAAYYPLPYQWFLIPAATVTLTQWDQIWWTTRCHFNCHFTFLESSYI